MAIGADEIPRGVVASLAQDRSGLVWIGTGDGLVRFDGFRFSPVQRAHADPVQRNLGWVPALLAAPDGRTWIGTETDGLAVYDPAGAGLQDLGSARGPREAGPHASIAALAQGPDGTLWLGTLGAGLQRLRPGAARIESLVLPGAEDGPQQRIQALAAGEGGPLWVGTWAGLLRGPDAEGRFHPVEAPPDLARAHVTALHRDDAGRLWAGTVDGGLARAPDARSPWHWVVSPDPGRPRVTALASTAGGGRLWVGTAQGIDIHDAADGCRLQAVRHDPARRDGLAGAEVSALMREQDGAFWVGGYGLGLQRTEPGGLALRVRRLHASDPQRLASLDARALLAWPDGPLWAALHDGPVALLDAQLRWTGTLPADGPPWQAMAAAGDGTAWLGRSGELRRVDRRGRTLQRLSYAGEGIHRLLVSPDGSLWIAARDGLYRWRPPAVAPQRWSPVRGTALEREVFALALAPDGALWLGGMQGLWRLPSPADPPEPVAMDPAEGLANGPNAVVLGLLFGRDGTLWVDTAVAGLHRMTGFDGRRARFDRVSARHGAIGRPFGTNLLEDARGRIWTHMHVYDPARDRLHVLTAADGAVQGTGWFRSFAALADGRLAFGGSQGLLVAEADRFDPPATPPALRWTGLRIDGLPRPVTEARPEVTLAPSERQVSIEFAALDFADPRRTRYRHRLLGVDADWVPSTAAYRMASYGNLPPGRYTLEVVASNRADTWTPQPLTITLEVEPAWWQRGPVRAAALLALLLAAAAGVGALVGRRTRTLQRQQRVLEARVHERTAALEDASRQLQAQARALEAASLSDPLTGLRNRRFLAQAIEADVAMALRAHDGPSPAHGMIILLVDIDRFKQVNDEFGHAAGDAVLLQVRDRLLAVSRDSDHVVRWGGEEFLILARDADRERGAELAERIRSTIAAAPFELGDGQRLARTVSIGFAAFPLAPACPKALDWEETLAVADAALLAAKRGGRDTWIGVVACAGDDPAAVRQAIRPPAETWAGRTELTLRRFR